MKKREAKIENKINVRVRLVIIHNRKLLVQYREKGKFYHYIGGHPEYGETIKSAAGLGFEPRLAGSEPAFLPLEDPALTIPILPNFEAESNLPLFGRQILC